MIQSFKVFICVALLSGLFSFSAMGREGSDELAPEIPTSDLQISLGKTPVLDKAFMDASPAERKGTVPVGRLGVDGGNKDMIVKLATEIAETTYGRYDSLLIAHKGKLLFESYYQRGRINLSHGQASATKAYLNLAIGRAIQLGHLTMSDLDKPLISFFKDLDTSKMVAGAEKITLHNAMTMSSGIKIDREKWDEWVKSNPDSFKGSGQVQAFLKHSEPITSQSQIFEYKPFDPWLVIQVLDAVVPGSAKDFIKNELLNKLGITNYGWATGISGLPEGPYGSRMTSRDMIKWGTLVMNQGKWKGEQLISEAFISKATHKVAEPDDVFFLAENVTNPGYGYYWWQADLKVGDKTYFSTSAQGGGGQYIILIEELDLIVVATGHYLAEDPDRPMTALQLTAERILPAFIK